MSEATNNQKFMSGKGFSEQDWDAVGSPELTDEEIARMRPAREVLPKAFFNELENTRRSRGRPAAENPKKQVTLRLDSDVLESFRASGPGWQSRINGALRKAAGL